MGAENSSYEPPAEKGIHVAIGDVMRRLYAPEADPDQMWCMMSSAALHLPEVSQASVTVVDHRLFIRCLAATDRHPQVLDEIQQSCREGPCLEAVHDHHVCGVPDLGRETRWPTFVEKALVNTPIRSIVCCPIFSTQHSDTTLNLYAEQPGVLNTDSAKVGLAFATHLAATVQVGRREKQFRRMLSNRDVIGQAKGVLMERFDIDAISAYALLARLSKEHQRSVSATARAVLSRRP